MLILVSLLSIIYTVVKLRGLMSFEVESPKKVCLCGDNKTYITNFRRLFEHSVSILDLNVELSKYPSV